ncbi:nodulation protein NfeD [Salinisphaera sp.]|uniref:NfeD family protein n=1 Tax=Salinisphaera sp. TaxID=1914330 RepID=UPI0025CCAFC4|nr:nodulation protein NfeD [Salinisphaera sp.]
MRRTLLFLLSFVALLTSATGLVAQPSTETPAPIREIAIEGPIGPATSAFIERELEQAAAANTPLIILRLDTPGGLDGAMRDIVKAILASPVPVAGYVAPGGARAASAGTYILYASHIAAMAPATNLGAATPVSIGGDGSPPADAEPEKSPASESDDIAEQTSDNATAKRRKAVNDAVAYIRSLAERRERNADWAEQAVREGTSLSAQAALDANVIDLIAADTTQLLDRIDGQRVETAAGMQQLNVAGARVEHHEPGWQTELLSVITNPTVAYLLFMIGIYGLILEGLNPGTGVPGVVGAISLLCALFAFQVLPVNYAGLALIALGIGLMIAEMFAPSFGILGLGGVAAFVFGSIMLMDTDVPGFEIPFGLIGGIAVASALLLFGILYMFLRSRRERIHTGHAGLIGSRCVALADFEREGRVLLHGESWLAVSPTPVARDDALVVTAAEGLKVFVRPAGPADTTIAAGNAPARTPATRR